MQRRDPHPPLAPFCFPAVTVQILTLPGSRPRLLLLLVRNAFQGQA